MQSEIQLLTRWKLIAGLLCAIVTPSVTLAGLYYSLKIDNVKSQGAFEKRIAEVELTAEENFADKDTVESMAKDISNIQGDIKVIKDSLLNKPSR